LLFSLYIPPPPHTSPLSLHDALPISRASSPSVKGAFRVESHSHPSNRNRSTIRNIFCERPNKPSLTTLKAPPLTLFVSTRDKFLFTATSAWSVSTPLGSTGSLAIVS